MSLGQKFQDSLKESLMIGGVAAIGAFIGLDTQVANLIDSVGLLKVAGTSFARPLILFGIVFTADMIYNLFLS